MSEKFKLSEEEISAIFSVPLWVKDEETALKFAIHLQYRLHQTQKLLDFWHDLTNLPKSQVQNYEDIRKEYDDVYAREKSNINI